MNKSLFALAFFAATFAFGATQLPVAAAPTTSGRTTLVMSEKTDHFLGERVDRVTAEHLTEDQLRKGLEKMGYHQIHVIRRANHVYRVAAKNRNDQNWFLAVSAYNGRILSSRPSSGGTRIHQPFWGFWI
jgi:hypothetical protein